MSSIAAGGVTKKLKIKPLAQKKAGIKEKIG
jgi:hypothetical protein